MVQMWRDHIEGAGRAEGLAALTCSFLLAPSLYPCHFLPSCSHRSGSPFIIFFSSYTSTYFCFEIDPWPLPSRAVSWFRGERQTQLGTCHFPRKMLEKVEPNLTNSCMNLDAPVEASDETPRSHLACQLVRDPAKQGPDSDPQKLSVVLWVVYISCVWIICYPEIDN